VGAARNSPVLMTSLTVYSIQSAWELPTHTVTTASLEISVVRLTFTCLYLHKCVNVWSD